MHDGDTLVRSSVSGACLTVAVLVLYRWRVHAGRDDARGLALATLIIGYQILVLVERAPSIQRITDLFPNSARFWLVWGASAIGLPTLMYIPPIAAVMSVRPLSPLDWLLALGTAGLAMGWRLASPKRWTPG